MIRILIRLVLQGIRNLALNPWAQTATLAAVTMVAFLSGLFLMALTTLNQQLGMARGETVFQVYWHRDTDISQIREQWQSYHHLPGLQYVKTYTPEEALRELGSRLGRSEGSLERGFPFLSEQRPLPATALLSFAPETKDIERWLADTTSFLESQPGVARVVTTPLRDELGRAWRKVSRYVIWPSMAFLAIVLGLVVANTVRLSHVARAYEIEILQIVGAFPWYIRLPLIVSGGLIGFSGGCIALCLLRLLHSQIRDVLNFPPLLMQIYFLPWPLAAALVIIPTLMAVMASWLAVRGQ
jgi:cell division transport system permease protein